MKELSFTISMKKLTEEIELALKVNKDFIPNSRFALTYKVKFFGKSYVFDYLKEKLAKDYVFIEISQKALTEYDPYLIFEESFDEIKKHLRTNKYENEIKKKFQPLKKLETLTTILRERKYLRTIFILDLQKVESDTWTMFRENLPGDVLIVCSETKLKRTTQKEPELLDIFIEKFKIENFIQKDDLKNIDKILNLYSKDISTKIKQEIKEYIEKNIENINFQNLMQKLFELKVRERNE